MPGRNILAIAYICEVVRSKGRTVDCFGKCGHDPSILTLRAVVGEEETAGADGEDYATKRSVDPQFA
jgi:hypothetical protein